MNWKKSGKKEVGGWEWIFYENRKFDKKKLEKKKKKWDKTVEFVKRWEEEETFSGIMFDKQI